MCAVAGMHCARSQCNLGLCVPPKGHSNAHTPHKQGGFAAAKVTQIDCNNRPACTTACGGKKALLTFFKNTKTTRACFAFSSPHCCFHSSKATFTKLRGCHSAGGWHSDHCFRDCCCFTGGIGNNPPACCSQPCTGRLHICPQHLQPRSRNSKHTTRAATHRKGGAGTPCTPLLQNNNTRHAHTLGAAAASSSALPSSPIMNPMQNHSCPGVQCVHPKPQPTVPAKPQPPAQSLRLPTPHCCTSARVLNSRPPLAPHTSTCSPRVLSCASVLPLMRLATALRRSRWSCCSPSWPLSGCGPGGAWGSTPAADATAGSRTEALASGKGA